MLPSINNRGQLEPADHPPQTPSVAYTYAVPQPDGGGDPAGIESITAFVWTRKGTVTAAAICGLLCGVAVSLASKPVYRAHTSMQIEGFNDQALHQITPVSPLPNASAADYL